MRTRLIPHNDYVIHVQIRLGRVLDKKEVNKARRNNTARISIDDTVKHFRGEL